MIQARKRFGQHFLEAAWVTKIIDSLGIQATDTFLEIGPGRGALTRPLVARAGRVIAIEIDRDLAGLLADQQIAIVAPRMPQVIAAFQDKLTTKLREAMAAGDDERVRQEVTLFVNRIDVDEELSRLTTHLAELKRILGAGGAVGKRLDFLMQELNREANTLGSKSADIQVTRVSLELKLLTEQMREQIQNIE